MCDTFCIRRRGDVLFAKSSDRPVDEAQLVEWFGRRAPGRTGLRTTHLTVPDTGAAALLGSRPTWMWGLEHGINEHGVAIGNEKVWTIDDPRAEPPALLGMDLVRLGLERGRTADAALDVMVELLAQHGQGGSGEADADEPYWSSFLVVDGRGGWVLETSGRSWVAQPVGVGAAISNRLTLTTAWTRSSGDVPPGADWDAWRAPAVPTSIADHRLAATRACVARGAMTGPAEAVAVLRDHGRGPWGEPGRPDPVPSAPPDPADAAGDGSDITVCMHLRGYQATTASLVASLPATAASPIRVWASLGHACTGVFLPVAIVDPETAAPPEAVVAPCLSDVSVWRQFAALGRRVEAPGAGGTALAEIRARLGPIEADAWTAADSLWAGEAPVAAWRAATRDWDAAVRAGLAELHA